MSDTVCKAVKPTYSNKIALKVPDNVSPNAFDDDVLALVVTNPAPDASASRMPTGNYRIMSFG